ncbi:MAG TPA: hypothetical protein VI759_00330 [Dehalococcoidia bacterium]|nr:hypothetical protein [Dehalococcoidia bacterium]
MSVKTFGYGDSEWEHAKSEVCDILRELARDFGSTIAYSELVGRVQAIKLHQQSPALAGMLEQISTSEDAAGRGMLSVLVVHKSGDLRPGRGFFDLAQRLGRDVSDEDAFWVGELKKVHDSWVSAT